MWITYIFVITGNHITVRHLIAKAISGFVGVVSPVSIRISSRVQQAVIVGAAGETRFIHRGGGRRRRQKRCQRAVCRQSCGTRSAGSARLSVMRPVPHHNMISTVNFDSYFQPLVLYLPSPHKARPKESNLT